MADTKMLTNEETLGLLRARVTDKGQDSFRMKVYRLRTQNDLPQAVCTLDDAQITHFASPETWLPKLAGGGPLFQLRAYHSSDTTLLVGSPILVQIPGEPPKRVDGEVLKTQAWIGPRILVWPDPTEVPASQTPSYSIPSMSPGAAGGVTAPQTSVPGQSLPVATNPQLEHALAIIEQQRQQLEATRREIELKERKLELERIQADGDRRMRELEAKITHNASNAGGGLEKIVAIAGAIAPVIQLIIQGQNEMRVAMLKAQQDSAQKQTDMLTMMMEKRADDSPATKMLTSMMETMGTFTKMQTDFIQTVAESSLGGPKEEPTGLKIVKELVKGANAVAQGMQMENALKARGAAPLRALPGQPGARPLNVGQARAEAAAAHARANPPTLPQAMPHPGVQIGSPPPVDPHVAGIPVADATAIQSLSTADKIEEMIRAKIHVDSIIDAFMAGIDDQHGDPEFREELAKYGNNPVAFFQSRLTEWVLSSEENQAYVRILVEELNAALTEAYSTEEDGEEDAEEDAA